MNTVIISKCSGFSFKYSAIKIGELPWTALTTTLARLNNINCYGFLDMWISGDSKRVYLKKKSGGTLSIFGIGDSKDPKQKTDGIIWAGNEKILIEALHFASIGNFFPYKVPEGDTFYIEDGECYVIDSNKHNEEEVKQLIKVLEL